MPSLEQLSDLRTPWCLHVVSTLHIAEHLAAGLTNINQLATAAGADAYFLHCVLSHLASQDVFAETEPGHFTLNATAQPLLDPASHLGLDLDGIGGRMAHAWSTLLELTRTGQPAYHARFGRGFWEDLDAHPAVAATFDALIGPAGHGPPDPHFPLSVGWHNITTIVDVGGGTGAMLTEILQAYPHLQGTLVDLPRTVARAPQHPRLTTAGQSFFDPLPAGADVYLLKGILNDWPDAAAQSILQRCADAARPHGRVVIYKGVMPAGAPKPLNIEMVLLGGRQRTLAELSTLATAAGLKVAAHHPLATELEPQ